MLMAACQFDYLRHLGFRDFKSVNAANPHSMPVNMKHNLDGFLMGLPEEALQDVDDELHGRVVVVKYEYPV